MRAPGFHAMKSQEPVLDLEVRVLSGNATARVGLQRLEHLGRLAGPACNERGSSGHQLGSARQPLRAGRESE